MNWRAVATVLLLAGALVSGWAVLHQRPKAPTQGAGTGLSDYVLRDFELISLDDHGKEAFTLRAPMLQQTPGARTMDLTTPLFLLPNESGHYWHVKSNKGWVSANRDQIRLTGNVRTLSPSEEPSRIAMKTSQLNVFPNSRKAATRAFVTVTQPGLTMHARGMQVDFGTRRYQLMSQVRSHYVPPR
ncbi:LPS export ABC transporter periplasmic protein LptC [Cognatiluteimonas telluris]|jgi:lipopolysaccharide export system protein LptC|uniref:LPS export ABC transporter periplasmic protein LptC n=1 Tax=Cognatiluteimonas telluris TaxID=1104775 RepID=UPI0014082E87|nr:LPS export ABC transporter periplasmic protein LptC [Lysobacter telluris]